MASVSAALVAGALLSGVGLLALRVHRFGRRPFHPTARQAIVVLGARVLPDGTPSEALVARVHHAVSLFRAGLAPALVLSGGGQAEAREAELARRLAVDAGVPTEACLVEAQSRSTFENARRSVEVLQAHGFDDVWLVTDDFHAYRAAAHFRRAGVRVSVAAVTRALSTASRVRWTLREVVALVRRPWLLH